MLFSFAVDFFFLNVFALVVCLVVLIGLGSSNESDASVHGNVLTFAFFFAFLAIKVVFLRTGARTKKKEDNELKMP